MTVQHFGGLHAAWLLNVCVCVACVCTHVCVWGSFLKKAHLRGRSAGVCGTLNDVYDVSKCVVCILMFAFFYFCATGPNCVTWTVLGTTTLLHIWLRVHVGWPATLRVKAKYPRANPLRLSERERERERRRDRRGEREKESWSVHLSLHPSVCLSLWTALSPSSQIRLLIVWASLDRFASNSHSCTGNVDETNKSQNEGLMRNVIFLMLGGVEEPNDDRSDMRRWLQAGETLENKTINHNVVRKR